VPHLTDLTVDFVSLVDRAAVRDPVQQSEPMRFLVWKRDDHTPEKGALMKTAEELTAELAKAEEARKAAEARAEKAEGEITTLKADFDELKRQLEEDGREPATKAEEKIDKSALPPEVRAYVEKAEAERAADRERAEKAEKAANEASEIAKAEREARLTKEFVAKAEGYEALVVKAEDFGPVLKEASEKLSKASFDEIERVLKAADEQIAKGDLFKEMGRNGEAPAADSALAKAETRAAELMKSDPKLAKGEALDLVFKADPELQAAYLAQVR